MAANEATARGDSHLRWEYEETPDPGTFVQAVPGFYWLRMPLPFPLAHINLWLLDDGDGFSIVDCGVNDDNTHEIWRQTISAVTRGASLNRVLVTHMHPDHVGSAGWLCEAFETDLWMSREEYLLCRVLTADTGREAPDAGVTFYRAAGFPDAALDRYQKMFGMFGRLVAPMPESYIRLQDGDVIELGASQFEIVVGRGHSPEHACLFDAERNLLIAGDQVLPNISSNVSVFPTEPRANPLADWLDSLRRLKTRLPDDVLVFPAHGRPFRNVQKRLDQLIQEHEDGLESLLSLCREPKRAIDTFPALFRAPIRDSGLIMATGESLAHLNYLIAAGELECQRDASGVDWYRSRN